MEIDILKLNLTEI